MDKIYSRRKINFNKKIVKMILLILVISLTIYIILKSLNPVFETMCKNKGMNIATEIINNKTSEVLEKYNCNDIITIMLDDEKNKILKTDIKTLNLLTSEITTEVVKSLKAQEKDTVKIPIGAITGNNLFSGFGPEFPVKIITDGNVETEIKTQFETVGINQSVYRIYMQIKCEITVVTSYDKIEANIENQVLLVETFIMGEVPETYYNLDSSKTGTSIPLGN